MSLEAIRQSVIEKANEEARAILEEAKKKASALVADAKLRSIEESSSTLVKKEAQLKESLERRLGEARRLKRLALLQEKNRLLDELFRTLTETARKLPPASYWRMIERWLRDLDSSVGGTIHFPSDPQFAPPDGFLERVSGVRGAGGKFLKGEDVPIDGGFMIRAEGFEMNYSISRRVEELRNSRLAEVARQLFSEDD